MKGRFEIKKYLKIMIYYIFLIGGTVLTLLLPKYNKHVFVLKHTFIFILAASIIVMVVKILYQELLIKYKEVLINKRLIALKGFTLLTIIFLLGLTRLLQLDYIKLYETPPVLYCYYYDEYGNYIHGSRFFSICPELQTITKTDQELKVRAEYIYPGSKETQLRGDGSGPLYRGIDGYAVVDIKIEYNDENYITYYTNQTSMNYELLEFYEEINSRHDFKEKGTLKKHYSSVLLSIKTDYSNETLTQTKTYYTKELKDISYNQVNEVDHYDFSSDRPQYEHQLSLTITNKDDRYLEFKAHNPYNEKYIRYLGHINYQDDSTELFYQYNPEIVNVEPKEISNTLIINDYSVTNSSVTGIWSDYVEYQTFQDFHLMIKTHFEDNNPSKIFELKDSIIVENNMRTYKVIHMDYGYKIEEYGGDNQRNETVPTVESHYLTWINSGSDYTVFDVNPITLEYDDQPIFNLNPMLKYLLEKNR